MLFSATYNSKKYIRILVSSILILYIFVSCGNNNQEYIDLPFDKETMPTVEDDSVTMMISDSGIIRYKVITKEWLAFDRASDPHWYFPKGIYVEQFDTTFVKQASIKADTAWNYVNRRLWHLKGNVFMKNIKEETFKTDELFWNEKEQKIYSDKYIEIYRPDKLTLQGIGFESNMDMTRYKIFRPFDSDFIVSDESKPISPDTIP